MAIDSDTGEGEYPVDEWHPRFRTLFADVPRRPLFDKDIGALSTKLGKVKAECVEMAKAEEERKLKTSPERVADIHKQARDNLSAIQPLFDLLGVNHSSHPEARELIRDILENIQRQIFIQKVKYGRARPRKACDGLEPLFEPESHASHPGHGSFPSGHATLAYCWAELLAHYVPAQASPLRIIAVQIARNRELAGVHFESDSAAGKELGEAIAEAIIAAKRISPMEKGWLISP